MRKNSLLLVTSLVAVSAVAEAQQTSGLEEIIVTARKRSEALQSAPVAVTAFTELTFQRQQVAGLKDIHLSVPNVTIVNNTTTSNSAQVFMRGIGRDDSTWNVESGVAIYMDGVYLPQQNGALLDLIDFERIEVLRGPQGTLYGRNATGGAIKFMAKRPDLNETTLKGDITVGSYERFDVRVSGGAPINAGKFAFKIDAVSRNEKGFVKRANTGERLNATDRQTGRIAGLWQPSDDLSVYVAADIQRDRSGVQTPTPIRNPATNALVILPGAKAIPGGFLASPGYGSRYIANPAGPNLNSFKGYGALAEVNYDMGWAGFKSLTSLRGFNFKLYGDLDGDRVTALDFQQDIDDTTFAQEFQLTSQGDGPLGYVLGAYYMNDDISPDANNIFVAFTNSSNQKSDSLAAFGELTYTITDKLSFTAGGRYTYDKKDIRQSGFRTATGGDRFNVVASDSWKRFTPKVGLDFKPTEDALLYASFARGFKAGGVVDGRPTNVVAASTFFEPEKVDSYEIGAKTEWLDQQLRVNLAGFRSNYKGIQLTFLNPLTNSISVITADGRLSGVEGEVQASITDGLTFYGTFGYLDDKYTRVPLNPVTGAPAVAGLTLAARFKHAPKFHYKLGFDYAHQLAGGGGTLGIGTNWMHTTKIYRNIANTEQGATQPYGVLDAQAYYETQDGKWRVTLAGQNLTDEEYWTQSLSTFARYYAKPTTWSLTVKYAM